MHREVGGGVPGCRGTWRVGGSSWRVGARSGGLALLLPAAPSVLEHRGWTWRAAATVPHLRAGLRPKVRTQSRKERARGRRLGVRIRRRRRGAGSGVGGEGGEEEGADRVRAGVRRGWRKPLEQLWGRTRQCPAFNLGSGGGERSKKKGEVCGVGVVGGVGSK